MKNKLQIFGTILLGASMFSASAFAENSKEKSKGHAKERVLVKFKKGVTEEQIENKLKALNFKKEKKINGIEIHLIKIPKGLDEETVANQLNEDQDIEFAEVDGIVTPNEVTPNDPYFNNIWGLKTISAPYAWDVTMGSSGITIAILDSGVEATHPDLAPNLVPGWNVASNNSNTSPITSHGTKVAGVAAAKINNSIGVSGVCGNCKIMPIRITDDSSGSVSYWSTVATGITYAADRGVKVANNSYMGWSSSSVISAAQYLKNKGGIFVASAGNTGATYSTFSDHKDMLIVSATDSYDSLYSWSARGSVISLSAPGNWYTTNTGGGYGSFSGTSFSAPSVAGLAALIFSVNPTLTPDQVMNILKSSADDLGVAGYDTNFGHGRINAERAVAMAGAPQPQSGSCGTSQGKTFTSTPTSNLCSTGTASVVTLTGTDYKWNCSGINGGATALCSAKYQAPDTTAPSAPGNLSGRITTIKTGKGKKATYTTAVALTWSASVDNVAVASYSITRNGVVIATTSSLSYSDKSVVKGTSYSYSISAKDAAGNKSASSNLISIIPN